MTTTWVKPLIMVSQRFCLIFLSAIFLSAILRMTVPTRSNFRLVAFRFGAVHQWPNAPRGGLVLDGSGDLFGTLPQGGAHQDGSVVELSAERSENHSRAERTLRIGIGR